MSEGGGGKKKAAGPPFRRGKWTTEEENYALRLITELSNTRNSSERPPKDAPRNATLFEAVLGKNAEAFEPRL
jgi:hypothetical protein